MHDMWFFKLMGKNNSDSINSIRITKYSYRKNYLPHSAYENKFQINICVVQCVPSTHMQLFNFLLIKIKQNYNFSSSVPLTTFPVFNCHLVLVPPCISIIAEASIGTEIFQILYNCYRDREKCLLFWGKADFSKIQTCGGFISMFGKTNTIL